MRGRRYCRDLQIYVIKVHDQLPGYTWQTYMYADIWLCFMWLSPLGVECDHTYAKLVS